MAAEVKFKGNVNNEAVTATPAVVYFPIRCFMSLPTMSLNSTYKSVPETATASISDGEVATIGVKACTVPAVVNFSTVPAPLFATYKSVPETAMPPGKFRPEMSEAFTVTPAVVYFPIVPETEFATYRNPPDTAMP